MTLIEIPAERHTFITELAEDVWLTYSTREQQVFLDRIVNAVDATLSYGDYGDAFDGFLECNNTRFHIYCNTTGGQTEQSPRSRFSIAHELGHFFIDEHRNALLSGISPHGSFTEHPSANPVETEANLFASNLLMPAKEYRKSLLGASGGLIGIIDTASTFRVSIQASALRCTAISRRPCAIVMFREGGKPPWWDISPELKMAGYVRVKKLTREGLPVDSATSLALHDSTSNLGSVRQYGTLASAWFDGVFRGSKHDEMFIESSMRLCTRGVLTYLEPCAKFSY